MKADSARFLFSPANAVRSPSFTLNWCRTRRRRRILVCGASSGKEDNEGLGERTFDPFSPPSG